MRFEECDTCKGRPGAPYLCTGCLLNRQYIDKLERAIREHRDQRGDDRCWRDDEELYEVLPEGYEVPTRDTAVELSLCERFIKNRQNPKTEYVSPEREIERLRVLIPNATIWATTSLEFDGTVNFNFHIEHGTFAEGRKALEKFIKIMQERLESQKSCPYYEPIDKS
jgi:hypothetical protein